MRNIFLALGFLFALISVPRSALAHCDTMDGPVVQAGLKALEREDLDLALIWVQPAGESELRSAFEQTRKVRKLGPDARAVADRYFLETLVRLHRAGEGEPYTGIKPTGEQVEPAIAAADSAIASGSPGTVTSMIVDGARTGIKQRLDRVIATRKYKPHDVRSGREYVAAYVAFIHYVEQLHGAVEAGAPEHAATPHGH